MLGCRARGLRPTVTLLPDGSDATRVAQVELAPRGDAARPIRCTTPSVAGTPTAGPYEPRPVPPRDAVGRWSI